MNFVSTMVLALAMSTDAFAASVSKGAVLHKPRITEALRTGIIFGVIEAITPLIGWGLGSIAAEFVADWDRWIALGLLLGIGSLMIRNGLRAEKAEATPDRKSTRLNSSHVAISYAVFCLKKKKIKKIKSVDE